MRARDGRGAGSGDLARRGAVAGVLATLLVGGGVGAGGSGAAASGGATDPAAARPAIDVPVVGRTTVLVSRSALPNDPGVPATAVALVHGVRRVPGGTVLYWSVGLPAGQPKDAYSIVTFNKTGGLTSRLPAAKANPLAEQTLIDARHHKVYTKLITAADGEALASPQAAFGGQPGVLYTYWMAFPALPPDVTGVDVGIGQDDVVHSVPVQDGVLEPAVPQTGPLLTGQAWPQIDLAAVANSYQPEQGVYTWKTEDSTIDRSVVTREGDRVSVDLSADVLFKVDSADLGPEAAARLRTAAVKVDERAAPGTVQVVGHTDSTASDAYNDKLSQRRAESVATALKSLVTTKGITYEVSGRGEREPVASNDTAAGRKENRRVSVVFTAKGAK